MLPGSLKPARVLLTLDAVGGVWRHVVDLAGALRDRGIACRLVGCGPPPGPARIRAEGAALDGIDLVWTDQPLDWLVDEPDALAEVPRCIESLAIEWRATLLHLSLPSQAVGVGSHWPVLVSAHSCMPTWWHAVHAGPMPPEWQWRKEFNARGFARADGIVVPSRSHGAALEAVYGRLPPLAVVPNAHAAAPPSSTSKAPFVLSAGRWWDPGKNGETLDAAAAEASWPVVMAGARTGPAGGWIELRHAAGQGELAPHAMHELMREAAIFASPSIYEPFGLAVLEAATEGAALLLADIPTFRELWSGAATFVAPRDAPAWRAAMDRLAGDDALRSHGGHLAAIRACHFSPARQLDLLADVYRRAMFPAIRRRQPSISPSVQVG